MHHTLPDLYHSLSMIAFLITGHGPGWPAAVLLDVLALPDDLALIVRVLGVYLEAAAALHGFAQSRTGHGRCGRPTNCHDNTEKHRLYRWISIL